MQTLVRLLPVLSLVVAAALYIVDVEGPDAYAARNVLPIFAVLIMSAVVLYRGSGRWNGRGARWPFAVLGFAVPAMGLSLYLHYGYETDLHGMFSDAVYPREVFRYLPIYTSFAGAVGAAIGWIIGVNVERH